MCVLGLAPVAPAVAQDAVEEAEAAPVSAVAETLGLVPASQTNVVVVGDLLGPTKALLASPSFERFMREGSWAQLVVELSEGEVPASMLDPAMWLAEMAPYELYVPSGIALATDDATMNSVGVLLEGVISGALAAGAGQADDEASAGELRVSLVESLERLESPRATVLVRFRNPAVGGQLLGMTMMFAGQAQQEGAPVQMDAESVSIELDVAELVPKEQLVGQIADSGLFGPDDDALVGRAADAIHGLTLGVRLWQSGDALVISVTPAMDELADAAGIDAAGVALLNEATGPALVYTRVSTQGLRSGLEASAALINKYRGTPGWEAMAQSPMASLLNQPESVLNSLKYSGDAMESVAWMQDGVRMVAEVQNPPAGVDLVASGWLGRLPDVAGVQVDGTTSGGQALADALAGVDDRTIAMQMFTQQANWGDGPSADEQMAEYELKTSKLRALLMEDAPDVFAAPSVALWDGGAQIGELGFRVTENGEEEARVRVPPVAGGPEILVGFAVNEGQDAMGWVRSVVSEAFAVGVAFSGEDIPEGAGELVEVDLVPGVTTYQYNLDWLRALAAEEGATFELTAAGDFNPHIADLGSVLVFSTSPGLTQKLANAMAGGGGVEAPAVDGTLVSYSTSTIGPMADALVNLGLSVERINVWEDGQPVDDPDFEQGRRVAGRAIVGLAELLRLVETGDTVMFDRDGVRRMEMSIRAAD